MEIKQYQVYWVNLDPTIGAEMNKVRPCVVLSPNEMNKYLSTVIIAPFTTTIRNYPSRVEYNLENRKSMIALDQIKTIDKRRISEVISTLSPSCIKLVKETIETMLVK